MQWRQRRLQRKATVVAAAAVTIATVTEMVTAVTKTVAMAVPAKNCGGGRLRGRQTAHTAAACDGSGMRRRTAALAACGDGGA